MSINNSVNASKVADHATKAQEHLKTYFKALPSDKQPTPEDMRTLQRALYVIFALVMSETDRDLKEAAATISFLKTKIVLGHGKTVAYFKDLNKVVDDCLPLRELNRNARPIRNWIAVQVWKEKHGREPQKVDLKDIEPIPISELRSHTNLVEKLDSKELETELARHKSIKDFNQTWAPSTTIMTPYAKIKRRISALENLVAALPSKQKAGLSQTPVVDLLKKLDTEIDANKDLLQDINGDSAESEA